MKPDTLVISGASTKVLSFVQNSDLSLKEQLLMKKINNIKKILIT